jgi:NAD(P)-dependent dehydrogenase (short-subunit alcohol dehydrogenase family)
MNLPRPPGSRSAAPLPAPVRKRGIRRDVIAPGFMDTPMGCDVSHRSGRAVTVRFGRQGPSWEVAYAALVLIFNESSYVDAHALFLDGGHLGGIVRG